MTRIDNNAPEIKSSNADLSVLFVGRFQPFHKGHFGVLQQLAQEYANVIIAIGSAQLSHLQSNPFTAGERYWMIRDSMVDMGMTNISIAGVDDVTNNAVWVRHVETQLPPFDVVVGSNPTVRRLFDEAGYKTILPKSPYDFTRYNGTRLRALIKDGKATEVQALMPGQAWDVMLKIGGVERIKSLFAKEK